MKRAIFRKPGMILLITAVFFVTITGILKFNAEMSIRQQILQWIYPALMKTGKVLGANEKVLANVNSIQPLRSLFGYAITLNDGTSLPLQSLKGKKILLVNTASDCGYTAQYEALQQLYDRYKEKLVVIAFPANDFKEQESGDDAAIASFCKKNYGISFPLARKTSVIKSAGQDQVFQWLSDSHFNGWCNQQPEWNFSKYLIDELGMLTHYFPSTISPMDPAVTTRIEQ